jgi:hypothetical protein
VKESPIAAIEAGNGGFDAAGAAADAPTTSSAAPTTIATARRAQFGVPCITAPLRSAGLTDDPPCP